MCAAAAAGTVAVLQLCLAMAYTPPRSPDPRMGHAHSWSTFMNTIIYIVGLIVVVGFILSFFGLG